MLIRDTPGWKAIMEGKGPKDFKPEPGNYGRKAEGLRAQNLAVRRKKQK